MSPKIREMKRQEEEADKVNQGWYRVILLFVAALVGILASRFVSIAVTFLQFPATDQTFGKLMEISGVSPVGFLVEFMLSVFIIILVFPLIYVRVGLNTTDAPGLWFFLAFQNGFFSDALVGDLVSQFREEDQASQGLILLLANIGSALN
jgi:hypothetical protein